MTATQTGFGDPVIASEAPGARSHNALRIGEWCFDPDLHRLRSDDRSIRVEPQVAKLLLFLAENPGRALTKEEILAEVWDGRFLSDSALTRTMTELRKALGDDARRPRFIETIPKRGYRLVMSVAEVGDASDSVGEAIEETRSTGSRHRYYLPGVVLLLCVMWSITYLVTRSSAGTASLPDTSESSQAAASLEDRALDTRLEETAGKLLAVLPLSDLSEGTGEDFFAEGMTEALISELAQSRSLGVVSRHSVDQLMNDERPLLAVARIVGIDALVEGSILRYDDRVRVTVQLTDLDREAYSWARSYEREISDVLNLQDEVTRAITREISATLEPTSADGVPERAVDPEVYELYLKGRHQVRKSVGVGANLAAEYFEKALEIDSTYAPAYAGLTEYYAQLAIYGFMPPEEALPKIRSASARGLMLDADLPEIYASLGIIEQTFEWDWIAAERGFERALEINPSHVTARRWYAFYLSAMGRFDEAAEQAEIAATLDPMASFSYVILGHVYFHAGRYGEVEKAFDRCEQLTGEAWEHSYLISSRLLNGQHEEALSSLRATAEKSPGDSYKKAILGWALARTGRIDEAEEIRRSLEQRLEGSQFDPYSLAIVNAGLGRSDAAITALEDAIALRSRHVPYVKVEPFLTSLRSDPRFVELTRSLGL